MIGKPSVSTSEDGVLASLKSSVHTIHTHTHHKVLFLSGGGGLSHHKNYCTRSRDRDTDQAACRPQGAQ